MGWERKRGKLMEFNRLILGDHDTTYTTQIGDVQALEGSRYVITLDADTVLPQGSTSRLIATLAHPLNRAEFDEETGRVIAGYTVLQPRTEVRPTSVNATLFTRVFAGDTGLDLYTLAVSDVYQDLFDEGTFVGKGIYDVGAFHRSLENRVPDNTLLSHDLFEGIHGRAGLVTDIVLYEDYPPGYLTYASRQHRWVRGDWQLLPWLLPRVPARASSDLPQDMPREREGRDAEGVRTIRNQLSALDRWKIIDNLRRSLRAPALVVLFLAGWLFLPGSPWLWTLVTVLISATPVLTGLLTALTRVDPELGLSNSLAPLKTQALRWLLSLTFLLYEAVLIGDAIATTLVRVFVTHRRLLQWVTAAHALRSLSASDGAPSRLGVGASDGAPSRRRGRLRRRAQQTGRGRLGQSKATEGCPSLAADVGGAPLGTVVWRGRGVGEPVGAAACITLASAVACVASGGAIGQCAGHHRREVSHAG